MLYTTRLIYVKDFEKSTFYSSPLCHAPISKVPMIYFYNVIIHKNSIKKTRFGMKPNLVLPDVTFETVVTQWSLSSDASVHID